MTAALAGAAAWLALAAAVQAAVQGAAPDDPSAADPVGIVADPCPAQAPSPPAALRRATRDFGGLCVYRADNARLRAAAIRPEVVFIGDSITQGWKDRHPAFFAGDRRVDRGIGGQTVPQMLVRFADDVVALRPRLVHIMAATNDIAGNTGAATLDTVFGQIVAMTQIARANRIGVILAATPPAAAFAWRPAIRPAPVIASLNARLARYAAREHLVFVDYGRVLATPDGAMRAAFSPDGVHPNAAGYAAMEPLTLAAIAAAPPSR